MGEGLTGLGHYGTLPGVAENSNRKEENQVMSQFQSQDFEKELEESFRKSVSIICQRQTHDRHLDEKDLYQMFFDGVKFGIEKTQEVYSKE